MVDSSLQNIIEKKIDAIESVFQKHKGYILTEDDLKCIVYSELKKIPQLGMFTETEDKGIFSIPIHTELSWYDDNGELSIIPDITILEPKSLSVLHYNENKDVALPSKQYSFEGDAIIFELKFIRNKTGIIPNELAKIELDYIKINKLFDKFELNRKNNKVFAYMVVFNKTNLICEEFEKLKDKINKEDSNIKLLYKTGDIVFPN